MAPNEIVTEAELESVSEPMTFAQTDDENED
jgi:hypothetical protein